MYDFDVTLMVLSQPSSYASVKLLQVFDYFNGLGLNSRLSTHPLELANMRLHIRRHLIILDGTGNSDYDAHTLAASLRSSRLSFVVLLLNNAQPPVTSKRRMTADLYLSIRMSRDDLIKRIIAALDSAPKAETSVEKHSNGQVHSLRLKQHPQWVLPAYSQATAEVAPGSVNQVGDAWILEDQGWRLVTPTGVAVKLTRLERKLMHRFLNSPASPVLHQEFEDKDGSSLDSPSRSLAVAVSRLRRKFRAAGISLPIQSSRGRGYQFNGHCGSSEVAGVHNDGRSFMQSI